MNAALTHSQLFVSVAVGMAGIAGITLAVAYNLWLCYLGVMSLIARRDAGNMTLLDKLFGYPTLLVGFALDVIANWVFMTVLLLELPKELTVSTRCLRHATDQARSVIGWFERKPTRLDQWRWELCTFILDQIKHHDASGGHSVKPPTK